MRLTRRYHFKINLHFRVRGTFGRVLFALCHE